MNDLSRAIDECLQQDPALAGRLSRHHFAKDKLLAWAETLRAGGATAEERRDRRNRVDGEVRAPEEDELLDIPEDAEARARGEELIRRGGVALCVMAGGMATRMGGVVKALVEAFDGKTFLDVRLAENDTLSRRTTTGAAPLFLMTSDATDEPIKRALGGRKNVETFVQDLSLRLTPSGELFRTNDGEPSTYATGHGDLPDALARSGLLDRFLAGGGEVLWIANLDNLGATVDPSILGLFLETGKDVMVEVCPKATDRGGIPVHAGGKLQVLEEFRLPKGFDPRKVRYFNTNTLLVRAKSLKNQRFDWTYFEVEKKVEDKAAIQFERLVQELTALLDATYVKVPRDGAASRFEPVKDVPELEARRETIRAIAKARGFV